MASLILSTRPSRSPQETVQINPLLSQFGLVEGIVNANIIQYIGKSTLTIVGAPSRLITSSYVGETLGGVSHYYNNQLTTASTPPWTIIAYAQVPSVAASALFTVSGNVAGSSTADRSLYVGTSGAIQGYLFDGAAKNATTTGVVVGGKPFFAAARGDGASVLACLNFEQVSLAATNSGYNGYTTPIAVFGYGAGGSLDGATAGLTSSATIAYVLKIDGIVPTQFLRQLAENPWLAFRAPSDKSWVSLLSNAGMAGMWIDLPPD